MWQNEGDIGVVTTKSGYTYLAQWTLAPGIDYYWRPLPGFKPPFSWFLDPEVETRPVVK